MDLAADSARLEWWANESTCIGSFEVAVTISPIEDGWEAHGTLTNPDDHEGFRFCCDDLNPVFTLRFDDNSTFTVLVTKSIDAPGFVLTEFVPADPAA